MKRPIVITITLVLIIFLIFVAIRPLSMERDKSQTYDENFLSISIIDGDTFEMANGEIIRLFCVDTPEVGEEGYQEAKNYLSSLILEKDLTIEQEGKDNYNRTLAWISVDVNGTNTLVNKEIVDNGYGKLFEYVKGDCERMK